LFLPGGRMQTRHSSPVRRTDAFDRPLERHQVYPHTGEDILFPPVCLKPVSFIFPCELSCTSFATTFSRPMRRALRDIISRIRSLRKARRRLRLFSCFPRFSLPLFLKPARSPYAGSSLTEFDTKPVPLRIKNERLKKERFAHYADHALLIRAELHRISGIECRFYKPLIHRLSRPSSGYPGMFQEICVDLRWLKTIQWWSKSGKDARIKREADPSSEKGVQ